MRHSVFRCSLTQIKRYGLAALLIACACAMLLPTIAAAQSSLLVTTGSDLGSNFVTAQPTDGSDFVTHPVARPEASHSINRVSNPLPESPQRAANAWPASNAHAVTRQPVASDALPLRPPSESTGVAISDTAHANLAVVVKALALVLGLFIGALWVARRRGWKPRPANDASLFQVLGEFPLASRRKATIVKFGPRLLVLADSHRGIEKITEVTDPAEVEQVMTMCQPQFGGQRISTIQDWMRQRGLQSGITSEMTDQGI